jgi:hypothetical protein
MLFTISDFYYDDGCECTRLHQNDPSFLSKIITGAETWVYKYDLETKHQFCQWRNPSSQLLKKVWLLHLNVKSMLIVLLIVTRLFTMDLYHRFKLNQHFYKGVLHHLQEANVQGNGVLVIVAMS